MKKANKKRQHNRLGINLWVSHESVGSFRADQTENISEGGIFIATTRPLPIGTVVYMDIHLEEQAPPLHAVGEVAWHRKADQHQAAGMGISFVHIEPEVHKRLQAYISTQLTKGSES